MKKLLLATAALALVAGCSKNNPPQPQVPMVQMCGVDPEDGDQECILVPQNQMAQANQQGFYQYQNGQYRDNSGNLMAAAAVGAAAAYIMSNNGGDRDRYYRERQQYQQRYTSNQNYDRPQQARQQFSSNPVAAAPVGNKPFVPVAAKRAETMKAPTGGLMAGHSEINLKDTRGTQAAAPSFAPAAKPVVPTFKPTAASQPRPAPTQFTPQSARQSFTPVAAKQTFKPSAASAPRSTYTPPKRDTFKPSSSTKSSFKPSSSKSSTKK